MYMYSTIISLSLYIYIYIYIYIFTCPPGVHKGGFGKGDKPRRLRR